MKGVIYPQPRAAEVNNTWGIDAQNVFTTRIKLDTARTTPFEIKIGGNFLWVFSSSSSAATAQLFFRPESTSDIGIRFSRGLMLRGVKFDTLYVTHAAQAGDYLDVMYTVERGDTVQIENPAISFSSIDEISDIVPPSILDSLADLSIATATATVVSAAAANKRLVSLRNPSSNTFNFRIGDSGVGAANGEELEPGEIWTRFTRAAVYAYQASGGNLTIQRTEDFE